MVEGERQPKTIRQLREEQGWSRLELAERLGVTPHQVQRWESGKNRPSAHNWWRLADLFRVSVVDLALGPAEQEPQDRPQSRHKGLGGEDAPGP